MSDKLVKFDPKFQEKIISVVMTDKTFLSQINDIMVPEHFESEAHIWIVDRILWYFHSYHELPTLEVFKQEVDKIKHNDEFKDIIIRSLRSIYSIESTDSEYIKDEYLTFCKRQTLKNAILKSVDKLENDDFDSIKILIDTAMRAGAKRDFGHDWAQDVERRLSEESRKTIPTGISVIDSVLNGGLAGGELGTIMAPTGAGKSWLLALLGRSAMLNDKKVVAFSMELNERYMANRYDTLFSGIEPSKLSLHPDKIREIVRGSPGQMKIKFYPARTPTIHTFDAYLKRLEMHGFVPDIILVDYADLMVPADRSGTNRYEALGVIYEELRGLAGELDIPIWTATQSQRSSLNDDFIGADRVSDSFQKIMTADAVLSLSRKTSDKIKNIGRIHVAKNRFGEEGATFLGDIDFAIGKIQFYPPDSDDYHRIVGLIKEGEQEMKGELVDKFSKFKKDNNIE